ncbi:hypothetical protein Q0M94_12055 [Deinococcus radiomollis]|uniref:hypothetical protein n=1 Tax=Deinococcus radiomollis TaxID=468916 RepID=UPI003891E83E
MTAATRRVFSAVLLCPGLSVAEVARLAGVHRDTAGAVVYRLEQAHLITRFWRVQRWAIHPAAWVLL